MKRTFPKFGYNPVTGEWNDSLTGEYLWSNVNVSEAVPDVMTPSTWSLWWIHHYEANPFEFPDALPFCGNICGRPYLNLSLLVSAYQAMGRDARKELQGDMVGSVPMETDFPTVALSKFTVYRTMLPGLLSALAQARRDQKRIPEFLATMPRWCRDMRQSILKCLSTAGLASTWRESIRPTFFRSCQMLRSASLILADPATKLHLELSNLIGEADANALLSNLSGTSVELESLGPSVGLAKVMDGRMSLASYMERYGHRGPHEMELSAPGLEDNPDGFERWWTSFADSVVDVENLLARQRAESVSAWQRFESSYPQKAKTTRRELDRVALAAKNREAVRSEVTRATRLIRRFLLRAGELTGLGNDVFFLSLDEVTDVLTDERSSTARIPARREAHFKYVALPSYPSIIIGRFDPVQWALNPDRRSDYFDSRRPPAAKSNAVKGFAGAAGVVEGFVRRIDCVEDGAQILPGEILVTVTTNIGWTPLFPRLAAIVTDVGAPLSHAAIVAREMGIPAVVGCGNATMLLKTGDRVRVDGGRGTVEILDQPQARR